MATSMQLPSHPRQEFVFQHDFSFTHQRPILDSVWNGTVSASVDTVGIYERRVVGGTGGDCSATAEEAVWVTIVAQLDLPV
jgi:hypothetical protein